MTTTTTLLAEPVPPPTWADMTLLQRQFVNELLARCAAAQRDRVFLAEADKLDVLAERSRLLGHACWSAAHRLGLKPTWTRYRPPFAPAEDPAEQARADIEALEDGNALGLLEKKPTVRWDDWPVLPWESFDQETVECLYQSLFATAEHWEQDRASANRRGLRARAERALLIRQGFEAALRHLGCFVPEPTPVVYVDR